MARILWAPSFQTGSYSPAVPIALELIARGHKLVVICEALSEPTFRSLGCRFHPTTRVDSYLSTAPRPADLASKRLWHANYVTALFEDVSEQLAVERYDAVMADPLETGADFAAEAARVPWFSYAHFAMNETGADVPFSFHFWDRQIPAADAFIAWWNEQRATVGLAPDPRPRTEHRWYRHSPWLTLILGLPDLVHPKGLLPPYAVRVGPLIWDAPLTEPLPTWVDTLGQERPAILASVSTARQADADLIVKVAEAMINEAVDVVATVAADHDLPALPANVTLAPFVPHGALIDRVSLVACHAGYGTVTRAACAGVPLLLFPTGRDQFQVAQGAVEASLAIALDPAHRDVSATREAIKVLLGDTTYRRRAATLARVARRYHPAAAAADRVDVLLRPAESPSPRLGTRSGTPI